MTITTPTQTPQAHKCAPTSTRRSFFTHGGAALGAGVATSLTAGAFAADSQLPAADAQLPDRDAVRQLHLSFTRLIESQGYAAAAELFDEHAHLDLSGVAATGQAAIRHLLTDRYPRQDAPVLHGAYRQSPAQQEQDTVAVDKDGLTAATRVHVEVQLNRPLEEDCTAAQMARMQGLMAETRWQSGRLDARYVKTRGQWRFASLVYRAA